VPRQPVDRQTEKYLGFDLVAALYQGTFQGKVWGLKTGQALFETTGTSIDDVLRRLRAAVESRTFKQEFRSYLESKHLEFLAQTGINSTLVGIVEPRKEARRDARQTGCFGCKSHLDNEFDWECRRCGWIICTSCGACGCGHPVYGPQVTLRLRDIERDRTEARSEVFLSFEDAKKHAANAQ